MGDRKISLFENLLLIIGILVIILGYFFVYGAVISEGMNVNSLQTIFLWLILIVLIIMVAVNEGMKEELKVVINNQIKEIQLLRDDLKRKK